MTCVHGRTMAAMEESVGQIQQIISHHSFRVRHFQYLRVQRSCIRQISSQPLTPSQQWLSILTQSKSRILNSLVISKSRWGNHFMKSNQTNQIWFNLHQRKKTAMCNFYSHAFRSLIVKSCFSFSPIDEILYSNFNLLFWNVPRFRS